MIGSSMQRGLPSFCKGMIPIDPFVSAVSLERQGDLQPSASYTSVFNGPWPLAVTETMQKANTSTVSAMTKECTYRTRVEIVEDKSDGLLVAEARVRPGILPLASALPYKAYGGAKEPKKVYWYSSIDKEIESPVDGGVVITPGECKLMIQSKVTRPADGQNIKTWVVLTKFGLSVSHPGAIVSRSQGEQEETTQVFRVNYADNAEWGCLVLRCTNDFLLYGNESYERNELLTVFFHRSQEDCDKAPYPPMVTITNLADQNYVPMLPGQIVQIVPEAGTTGIEDYQNRNDDTQAKAERCLIFHSEDRLTKNGKFWVYRYECLRVPEVNQMLFIQGEKTASVIVPPLRCDGKDVFAVITEPYKSAKISCENLTSLRIRFMRDIPMVEFPNKFIECPLVNEERHELVVNFLKKLGTLTVTNAKEECSISCALPGFGTHHPQSKKPR